MSSKWKATLSNVRAFTLVELLVVIAVIGLLASLVLPALSRAKEQARNAKCMSNLHQIITAMMVYVDDNHVYPALEQRSETKHINSWYDVLGLGKWNDNPSVFRCPSFRHPHFEMLLNGVNTSGEAVGSYGYNSWWYGLSPPSVYVSDNSRTHVRESKVAVPARMIAVTDSYLVKTTSSIIGEFQIQYYPLSEQQKFAGFKDQLAAICLLYTSPS